MIFFFAALYMYFKRKNAPSPDACTEKITGGQVGGTKVSL